MTTDDYARRSTAQSTIAARIDQAESLFACAASPRTNDGRRCSVLGEAMGDLDAALVRGHGDLDTELALIAAICQHWLEDRLAALSRCVCPIMPGVGAEDRCVNPACAVHGEAAA